MSTDDQSINLHKKLKGKIAIVAKVPVNNALVFPGVFRGALDHHVNEITIPILIKAAKNLAGLVKKPTPDKIIPSIFDKGVVKAVSSAIK